MKKSVIETKKEDGSVSYQAVIEMGMARAVRDFETAKEARGFLGLPGPKPQIAIDARARKFQMQCLHALAYETCGRLGELLVARWDDFDLEGRGWVIPAVNAKDRKARVVPLTADAVRILDALQPISHLADQRVFHALTSTRCSPKAFKLMMAEMGLPCRNFPELRWLAIKRLQEWSKLPDDQICQILGRPSPLPVSLPLNRVSRGRFRSRRPHA